MTKKINRLTALDSRQYKEENLAGWAKNSRYWMNSPLRHVIDNDSLIDEILGRLLTGNETVVDVGCGDGFLYRKIRSLWPEITYIGLDFNDIFVRALDSESRGDPLASFRLLDIEQGAPSDLIAGADVVFSYFVFLEIADISRAFLSCASLLRDGGRLSVFTIEYVFLALAISHDYQDLKANLAAYESVRGQGKVPYTFQKIDLGDGESRDLTYGSVFHSTADYITSGLEAGLELIAFRENIRIQKYHPKVYQYMEFVKG